MKATFPLITALILACHPQSGKEPFRKYEGMHILDTVVRDFRIGVSWDSTGRLKASSYNERSGQAIDTAISSIFGYTMAMREIPRDSLIYDITSESFVGLIIHEGCIYFSLADQFKERAALFGLKVSEDGELSFLGIRYTGDPPLESAGYVHSGSSVIVRDGENRFFLLSESMYSEADSGLCRSVLCFSPADDQFRYAGEYLFCEHIIPDSLFNARDTPGLVQLIKLVSNAFE